MTRPADGGYEHLVGQRFPGGKYTLPAHEAWLWADAVGTTPDPRAADPVLAYLVGLHGGGASIAEIMAWFDADPASGVLFGEMAFAFERPLRPGTTYEVEGGVLAVERKHGRRAGAFDRVTFEHRLSEAGREQPPVATVTHVWIFPRTAAS